MAWHVVIAGGGYGGFYTARALEKRLPVGSARITLVNDTNFFLFTPLLPGAAGGTLEPRHVVVPLREQLHRTDLRVGTVIGANPERNCLRIQTMEGHSEEIGYDHLVVALGSVSRTLPVPGLAEHGRGFKTLPEAIALRNSVIRNFEAAETLDDPAEREPYLNYVFVGAGYAGVEGLAEAQDLATDVIQRYPRCRTQGMRWVLVEAKEQIMPEVPPSLADFAQRELRRRGIEVCTNTTLDKLDATSATLSDGQVIPTSTLVWTAGVRPHPVVERLGLPLAKGRVVTDSFCQVPGHDNVWAIGDAAAVPDPAKRGQEPSPPTAQHGMRQGKVVAHNIAAALGRGRRRKFTYRTLGVFVDMGRRQAVAQTVGIRWRGTIAWLLARTYHLLLMPGWGRRARLLVDWNVGLLFGRDASELGQLGHPPRLTAHSAGGTGDGSSEDAAAPDELLPEPVVE
jgi:NADH:ubiquinone reductase (H+-translocating)